MTQDKTPEEIEAEVKRCLETIIGKEPYNFEKICNGARLSEETINALRKKLGLPPRT